MSAFISQFYVKCSLQNAVFLFLSAFLLFDCHVQNEIILQNEINLNLHQTNFQDYVHYYISKQKTVSLPPKYKLSLSGNVFVYSNFCQIRNIPEGRVCVHKVR